MGLEHVVPVKIRVPSREEYVTVNDIMKDFEIFEEVETNNNQLTTGNYKNDGYRSWTLKNLLLLIIYDFVINKATEW